MFTNNTSCPPQKTTDSFARNRVQSTTRQPFQNLVKALFKKGPSRALLGALVFLPLVLSGCVQPLSSGTVVEQRPVPPMPEPGSFTNTLESSYASADNLAEWLRFRGVDPERPILAATFVNVDNLMRSSTLGRIISEQTASRLAQHGFRVIETKLRHDSIFIQKGKGEFLLSREIMELSVERDAYAVLVGTYAVSDYAVLVSARMVRTEDSSVIAGYDYEIIQDKNIRSML